MCKSHHPTVWHDCHKRDDDQGQRDLQSGALDREIVNILLAGLDDLETLDAAVAAKIPINEPANDGFGGDGSGADGDVAEADLDGVKVVGGAELGGETGGYHAEAGEVDSAEDHEECGLLFDEDREGSEETRSLLVLDSIVCHGDVVLAELPLGQVGHERDVPSLRADGAVSNDIAAGFGHEEKNRQQHYPRIDVQEPEDRSPAQKMRQETADNGPKCRAKRLAHRCQTHITATFCPRGYVRDYPIRNRYCAAAAATLDTAKYKQGSETVLQREARVGGNIDNEADQQCGPTTVLIGNATNDCRCNTLKYLQGTVRLVFKLMCEGAHQMVEETGPEKAAAEADHAYSRFSNSENIEKGWSSMATLTFLTFVATTGTFEPDDGRPD
ncbi:hypothetical protein V502_05558 [Pseudogymnoascus sp. VKM F-4520 (FW-2644)]|nr:hypothetical protein V502_05558 [Pseudogymnoascus sp. VKM F-4520 (FW-2644)]